MPIRVVTKEVRYIHALFLAPEYSTPVRSSIAPGLTGKIMNSAMQRGSQAKDQHFVAGKGRLTYLF